MLRRLALAYDAQLRRRPLAVKCATSACVVGASDLGVQFALWAAAAPPAAPTSDEGVHGISTLPDAGPAHKSGVDVGRSAFIGAAYGGCVFAPVLHTVTTTWHRVLPSTALPALVLKTVVDMTTSFPVNMAANICVQSVARHGYRGPEPLADAVRGNLWPAVTAGWQFWPLASMAMYGAVPLHYRVLFLNANSFFWNAFLVWRFA